MPFATIPPAETISGPEKRRVILVAIAIVIVLAGVGIWAAVRPGSYGASKNGCITVTLPSSTGGGLMHQCGPAAKAACRHAYASHDRIAALIRPQCRLAGLGH
jgi:hypothetical protein